MTNFALRVEYYYELRNAFSYERVANAVDLAGSATKAGFTTHDLPRVRDQMINPAPVGGMAIFVASVEHDLNLRWSDEVEDAMVVQSPQVVVGARTSWPGDAMRDETIGRLQDDGWVWVPGDRFAW